MNNKVIILKKKRVVVIGAGPAGLTAAYELLDKSNNYEVIVLEESNAYGGISKTVNYNQPVVNQVNTESVAQNQNNQ